MAKARGFAKAWGTWAVRAPGSAAQPWRSIVFGPLVAAVLAAPALGVAVPDLTGTWILRDSDGTEFVEVAQDGETVFLTAEGMTHTGTVSESGELHVYGLDGEVSEDGKLLNAARPSLRFLNPPLLTHVYDTKRVFGRRCGCVDGNRESGDGCDANCQVEPCWTCNGSPSGCVPAADGASCEHNPCIGGSSCDAGVCTGGEPIMPCADMSGIWRIHTTHQNYSTYMELMNFHSFHYRRVEQHGNHIILGDSLFGTIDPPTGTVEWTELEYDCAWFQHPAQPPLPPGCGSEDLRRYPFSGMVQLDGSSYSAAGTYLKPWPPLAAILGLKETGMRPPPCGPEGAPCSSGDPCFTDGVCSDGVCQEGSAVECGLGAYCDGTRGGCVFDRCPGDCNADGRVTIDELMNGASILLNRLLPYPCTAFDLDLDSELRIDELIRAVQAALDGC